MANKDDDQKENALSPNKRHTDEPERSGDQVKDAAGHTPDNNSEGESVGVGDDNATGSDIYITNMDPAANNSGLKKQRTMKAEEHYQQSLRTLRRVERSLANSHSNAVGASAATQYAQNFMSSEGAHKAKQTIGSLKDDALFGTAELLSVTFSEHYNILFQPLFAGYFAAKYAEDKKRLDHNYGGRDANEIMSNTFAVTAFKNEEHLSFLENKEVRNAMIENVHAVSTILFGEKGNTTIQDEFLGIVGKKFIDSERNGLLGPQQEKRLAFTMGEQISTAIAAAIPRGGYIDDDGFIVDKKGNQVELNLRNFEFDFELSKPIRQDSVPLAGFNVMNLEHMRLMANHTFGETFAINEDSPKHYLTKKYQDKLEDKIIMSDLKTSAPKQRTGTPPMGGEDENNNEQESQSASSAKKAPDLSQEQNDLFAERTMLIAMMFEEARITVDEFKLIAGLDQQHDVLVDDGKIYVTSSEDDGETLITTSLSQHLLRQTGDADKTLDVLSAMLDKMELTNVLENVVRNADLEKDNDFSAALEQLKSFDGAEEWFSDKEHDSLVYEATKTNYKQIFRDALENGNITDLADLRSILKEEFKDEIKEEKIDTSKNDTVDFTMMNKQGDDSAERISQTFRTKAAILTAMVIREAVKAQEYRAENNIEQTESSVPSRTQEESEKDGQEQDGNNKETLHKQNPKEFNKQLQQMLAIKLAMQRQKAQQDKHKEQSGKNKGQKDDEHGQEAEQSTKQAPDGQEANVANENSVENSEQAQARDATPEAIKKELRKLQGLGAIDNDRKATKPKDLPDARDQNAKGGHNR